MGPLEAADAVVNGAVEDLRKAVLKNLAIDEKQDEDWIGHHQIGS